MKRMKLRHRPLLLDCLSFNEQGDSTSVGKKELGLPVPQHLSSLSQSVSLTAISLLLFFSIHLYVCSYPYNFCLVLLLFLFFFFPLFM